MAGMFNNKGNQNKLNKGINLHKQNEMHKNFKNLGIVTSGI